MIIYTSFSDFTIGLLLYSCAFNNLLTIFFNLSNLVIEETNETMASELDNLKEESERLEGATKDLGMSIVK